MGLKDNAKDLDPKAKAKDLGPKAKAKDLDFGLNPFNAGCSKLLLFEGFSGILV